MVVMFRSIGGQKNLTTDEVLTEKHVDLIRENGVTYVELRGKAARSRSSQEILADIPEIVSLDLHSPGKLWLSDDLLARLETLGVFGKCETLVRPESLLTLRTLGGNADILAPGNFGSSLENVLFTRWSGRRLVDLPLGESLRDAEIKGIGQTIEIGEIDLPLLRRLDIHDVEIESLEGVEGAPSIERLGIHPKNEVTSLRRISLEPLSGARSIKAIIVGRQGYLESIESVADLPFLDTVLGYESFFPEAYRGANWATVLPDKPAIRRLLGRSR